jgi:hypothetical protein
VNKGIGLMQQQNNTEHPPIEYRRKSAIEKITTKIIGRIRSSSSPGTALLYTPLLKEFKRAQEQAIVENGIARIDIQENSNDIEAVLINESPTETIDLDAEALLEQGILANKRKPTIRNTGIIQHNEFGDIKPVIALENRALDIDDTLRLDHSNSPTTDQAPFDIDKIVSLEQESTPIQVKSSKRSLNNNSLTGLPDMAHLNTEGLSRFESPRASPMQAYVDTNNDISDVIESEDIIRKIQEFQPKVHSTLLLTDSFNVWNKYSTKQRSTKFQFMI